MPNISTLTREEFEETTTIELKNSVAKAKEVRGSLRLLEAEINTKEKAITNYQKILSDLYQQLVKIQSILYAGGTA